MKIPCKLLVSTLFAASVLSACSEKVAEAPAPAVAPAAAPAPAPEPVVQAGGYVPSAEELIPGATIPQEELDKKNAEALKDTPKPIIPGETQAVAAPAEAPSAAK